MRKNQRFFRYVCSEGEYYFAFWLDNEIEIVLRHQFNISGVVVASACSVSVESEGSQNGMINFGQYNQAKEEGGLTKPFSVKLYEI